MTSYSTSYWTNLVTRSLLSCPRFIEAEEEDLANELSDELCDELLDELCDELLDELCDELLDELCDELCDELLDELCDEFFDDVSVSYVKFSSHDSLKVRFLL